MPKMGSNGAVQSAIRKTRNKDAFAVLASSPVKGSWLENGQDSMAPRQDYLEIAGRVGASLGGYDFSGTWYRWVRKLENCIRVDPLESFLYLRKFSDCDVILSMSEKMALPTAAFLQLKRVELPHIVIAHKLSSGLNTYVFRAWPLHRQFAHVICLCRAQAEYAVSNMGLPPEKVDFAYDKVDHHFFRPQNEGTGDYILAVGSEQRDYRTLIDAVTRIGCRLVIVASSPWFVGKTLVDTNGDVQVLHRIPYRELRDTYSKARLVVLPLKSVDYAAGVNTLLESMAMAKPVIVSRTKGIEDYVVDGETGLFVEPEDVSDLHDAIAAVLASTDLQQRLGTNARQVIEERMNLDIYADRVAEIVRNVASQRSKVEG
jgi:glycosyltransferase involved in cell wall biosynthesis